MVDALVSEASGEIRAGSNPVLCTIKDEITHKSCTKYDYYVMCNKGGFYVNK